MAIEEVVNLRRNDKGYRHRRSIGDIFLEIGRGFEVGVGNGHAMLIASSCYLRRQLPPTPWERQPIGPYGAWRVQTGDALSLGR